MKNTNYHSIFPVFMMALASTLFAGVGSSARAAGIVFPDTPLQSGTRVEPNILFILDDSGSMAWDAMPASSIQAGIEGQSYVNNSVYYNPALNYRPWKRPDGGEMVGGGDYTAVYGSYNLVGGSTINLFDPSSCRRFNRNNNSTIDELTSGGAQVCGGVQTFYVPRDVSNNSSAYLANQSNYYRYQILTNGRVVRSEWLSRSGGAPNYNNGVSSVGCTSSGTGAAWRQCTYLTPTGRTEAAERQNYAIWFSYHRTRMKAAKAGAGEAFVGMDTAKVRVGFRTIWARNSGSTPVNRPTHAVPIPVAYNNGLFEDAADSNGVIYKNKTQWFERLYGTIGSSGTPLHGALDSAGRYFQSSAANGPWGPQTGADQISCRQNFTILTTDGYWNDTSSNYSASVGEQDNAAGTPMSGPGGQSYTYTPAPPYASTHSNTLADVAMRYWKTDLRTDMPNVVPSSSENPAFWQHMVTFGISIGLKGTLDPNNSATVAGLKDGSIVWPNPNAAEDERRIDDLWHAAVNGRGQFIAAANPTEFANGLKAALSKISERLGSSSNVAASTTGQITTGSMAFSASFVSGTWTGELQAYAIDSSGITGASKWKASEGIPTAATRKIWTIDSVTKTGTTFPTAAQLPLLARSPVSAADNLAYIKGNQSQEGDNPDDLRKRSTVLGDIINSSPVYDAVTDTVYVGANDGMLHAINAKAAASDGGGTERFAYVPAGINFTHLARLSDRAYSHHYFVDGPLVLSSRSQTPNKSYLAGALGRGGKGLFVLDVTTPATFGASDVKWEANETPGGNMGQILGKPIIAKLNNSATAVIVPNGVNSSNHRAALLIYDLVSGALLAEIDTGAGNADLPNGLSEPVGRDMNGDGVIDIVYAGDMQGNLWKFNLASGTAGSWTAIRLYTATDASGKRQPITGAPAFARDPATYRSWVFFATGRYMTTADVTDTSVQSVYAIQDLNTEITGRTTASSFGDLQPRHHKVTSTVHGREVRGYEPSSLLPLDKKGWFLDLVDPPSPPGTASGERVDTGVQTLFGALVYASRVPSHDPCMPGGDGWLNALDAFTGTSLTYSFWDLNADGSFKDEVIGSGEEQRSVGSVKLAGVGSRPLLLDGMAFTQLADTGGGFLGGVYGIQIQQSSATGRVTWRELKAPPPTSATAPPL
ncbi:MAG: PilC/PilY family type IV pilus protein [Pseudomonadota bacterium]|nr:PilC/PilY family type IV pilus protein [Pseudomonadota bacterium]